MDSSSEWLEPDGLGGFAMGTVAGLRTRRYHSLLTCATHPPTRRVALVGGVEVWLEPLHDGGEPIFLSSQRYDPDIVHPDGHTRITSFTHEPWPTWVYRVGGVGAAQTDDGRPLEDELDFLLVFELFCHRGSGDVVLSWQVRGEHAPDVVQLAVRPLLAVRDYHALHRENDSFRFDATCVDDNVAWRPYDDRPAVTALSNGRYEHAPSWYRNFTYEQERLRGLDHIEDLASPGVLRFRIGQNPGRASVASPEAIILLRAGHTPYGDAAAIAGQHRDRERARRSAFGDPLARAAEAYVVKRGHGSTVVAGYPWFTDWGRDTFIAMRGLCLATGRFDEAYSVLSAWADAVSEGMLPNRFTDAGEAPEFNAVDASLWYAVVVGELIEAADLSASDQRPLLAAVQAILRLHAGGTRYRIRADDDGLLAAGEPGVQLTWMDAKIGDRVITPRIGKPVEIQALWINALAVGERIDPALEALRRRATASFLARFPVSLDEHPDAVPGALYDVVDVDHVPGKNDPAFRPNQLFAVGGLPIAVLQDHGESGRARALVDAAEARLWTPTGPRSLDPADPAYRGRYHGGVVSRDESYHQGTVWQWLAGAFIEAWLRVRGSSAAAKNQARERFLPAMLAQLETGGLGHVAEIADGDAPHEPRGTPFQAWSVGELLRIRSLLGDSDRGDNARGDKNR